MKNIKVECCDCKRLFEKKIKSHIRCLSCANSKKAIPKEFISGICVGCFSEFKKNMKTQKFCSIICRKKIELLDLNKHWITNKKKGSGSKTWGNYK